MTVSVDVLTARSPKAPKAPRAPRALTVPEVPEAFRPVVVGAWFGH
ncbi:hypothetical protein [Streptomyces sp. NPDC058330]